MENYAVSFDGFEPSCGWPFYRHVENEVLPALKSEVERWRGRRDASKNERAALKEFRTDLEDLAKSRRGLVAKLQARIAGDDATLNDVMPLGVQEKRQEGEKVETDSTWQELYSWLDEAESPIAKIDFYCKCAYERADIGLELFETCFESSAIDIRFWERTLELQKAYWIFEKAELKYKTRICRELVKMLGDYICDCREQLGRYDEEKRATDPLYQDIKWLFDEALEDQAYYRQIKTDIAAVGVEEALEHSSRKVTQNITDSAAVELPRGLPVTSPVDNSHL